MTANHEKARSLSAVPAIETRQLSKIFSQNIRAVDALDLLVSQNSIYALLGPNGAGKTTIISMLTTLAEPTTGSACICGLDVVSEASKVRQQIGVTFQEMVLDDALTGRQVLDYHARLYGIHAPERRARIKELLGLVELLDAADRRCKTYSGGMKRRLELARALMTVPRVLFIDEPTLGLDPKGRVKFWDYIRDLKQYTELTILLTTHYLHEAQQLADQVGILDSGRLVVEGEPSALINALGADTIRILGSGPTESICASLSTQAFVQSITKVDGGFLLGAESSSRHLAKIVSIATEGGFAIEDVSVGKPDLGAVFFKYTGHPLREEPQP